MLGLLNSAVAAYYYLRLMVVMYMYEPGEVSNHLEPLTPGLRAALLLPAIGTFLLGVLPGHGIEFAHGGIDPSAFIYSTTRYSTLATVRLRRD